MSDVLNEFDRMNRQLNEQMILLLKGQTRVETTVEGHGKKLDKLEHKIDEVKDELSDMPRRWKRDSHLIVESEFEKRDEITAVKDLTEERVKAKYEGKKKHDGWFRSFFKEVAKPVVGFLLIAGMAVGAGIAVTRCSADIDKATLQETKHAVDELQAKLKDR